MNRRIILLLVLTVVGCSSGSNGKPPGSGAEKPTGCTENLEVCRGAEVGVLDAREKNFELTRVIDFVAAGELTSAERKQIEAERPENRQQLEKVLRSNSEMTDGRLFLELKNGRFDYFQAHEFHRIFRASGCLKEICVGNERDVLNFNGDVVHQTIIGFPLNAKLDFHWVTETQRRNGEKSLSLVSFVRENDSSVRYAGDVITSEGCAPFGTDKIPLCVGDRLWAAPSHINPPAPALKLLTVRFFSSDRFVVDAEDKDEWALSRSFLEDEDIYLEAGCMSKAPSICLPALLGKKMIWVEATDRDTYRPTFRSFKELEIFGFSEANDEVSVRYVSGDKEYFRGTRASYILFGEGCSLHGVCVGVTYTDHNGRYTVLGFNDLRKETLVKIHTSAEDKMALWKSQH